MKELFKNRVFKIIMTADVLQQMCIWIRNMVVLFYVIDKTNSNAFYISLVSVFEFLPMFVLSYIGGTFADRWNPKKTMIYGDVLSSVSVLCILFIISQGAWEPIFAVTFISSSITQFSVPSSVIMFKRNIDNSLLTPAISFSQALQSLYIIIGPVIGSLFYTALGVKLSLAIISALMLISASVQLLLPNSKRDENINKVSFTGEMMLGIDYIKKSAGIKTLAAVLFVFGLAQGLIQPLIVFVLSERLMLDKDSMAWFFMILGAGLLIGAVLSSFVIGKYKTKNILFTVFICFGIFTAVEVLSTNVYLTGAMYFLYGTSAAFIQVAISSPLIKNIQEDYIGRISGLITPLVTGGVLIGSAFCGIAYENVNLIPMYLISAAFTFLCAFVSLKYKDI